MGENGNGNGKNGNGDLLSPEDFALLSRAASSPPTWLRDALYNVPREDWNAIVRAMVAEAKTGNVKAFLALAKFVVSPAPRENHVEVTGQGGEPLKIVIERIQEWRPDAADRLSSLS